MKPVILTALGQPVSSFGFFLLLSLFAGAYFIWRIIRSYELDEEQVLDLLLLTFAGGLVGARAYFILSNPSFFDDFSKIFLINKYPGLSFWGALLGGLLTLKLFSLRFKLNFFQLADIAVVGLFAGMALTSVGCLLGSCQYGQPSGWPVAVTQAGLLGKRFPLQIIEGFLFLLSFLYLWKGVLRFHFNGKIFAQGLLILGTFKLFLEPFRGDIQLLGPFPLGAVWSIAAAFFGVVVYYRQSKRSALRDFDNFLKLFSDQKRRELVVSKLAKNWYNFRINRRVKLEGRARRLLRFLNVKSNPNRF